MAAALVVILIAILFAVLRQYIWKVNWEKQKEDILKKEKLSGPEKQQHHISVDYRLQEAIKLKKEGDKYIHKLKVKKAVFAYTKAIELNPAEPEYYRSRAFAYSVAHCEFPQLIPVSENPKQAAIDDYTRAIQLNPKDAFAYHGRAVICSQVGNYKQSIEDNTKAIDLKADYSCAYYSRGLAYEKLGNEIEAIKDIKQSANLGYEDAQKYLKKKRIT